MAIQKRRADPQKKRADIMRKAMKLFMVKGFDATSTNDICVAAKLTKPSLYHYFQSKNHLLFCVHMQAIDEILHPYLDAVRVIREPEKRLQAMIRDYTIVICSNPQLRFILHGSLLIQDRYFDRIREEWKKFYLLLRDTIAELQSTERIRKDIHASWAALQILGMITWMTFWFDHKRRDAIDKLADSAVDMAFRGIGLKNA